MNRKQALIDEILQNEEESIDRSLRGNALRRATGAVVPRTLTAWEWEEYYRVHGRPHTHDHAGSGAKRPTWRRLWSWLTRSKKAGRRVR